MQFQGFDATPWSEWVNAIRTFIGIHLPEWIQQKLGETISRINTPPLGAVRWVPAHNIHLTLKFLGDVSPANLNTLVGVLRAEAARHKEFEVEIEDLGAFPSIQRPRVIWIGVKAPPILLRLQHGIESETRKLGYPTEDRPFSPHLTLGRVSSHASPFDVQQIARRMEGTQVGLLGNVSVDSITIFRSDLNPGGSVYSVIQTASLAMDYKKNG